MEDHTDFHLSFVSDAYSSDLSEEETEEPLPMLQLPGETFEDRLRLYPQTSVKDIIEQFTPALKKRVSRKRKAFKGGPARATVNIVCAGKKAQRRWLFWALTKGWTRDKETAAELQRTHPKDIIQQNIDKNTVRQILSYIHKECFEHQFPDGLRDDKAEKKTENFRILEKASTLKSNVTLELLRDSINEQGRVLERKWRETALKKATKFWFEGVEAKHFGAKLTDSEKQNRMLAKARKAREAAKERAQKKKERKEKEEKKALDKPAHEQVSEIEKKNKAAVRKKRKEEKAKKEEKDKKKHKIIKQRDMANAKMDLGIATVHDVTSIEPISQKAYREMMKERDKLLQQKIRGMPQSHIMHVSDSDDSDLENDVQLDEEEANRLLKKQKM